MKRHSPNMRQRRRVAARIYISRHFPAARMPPAICAAPQNSRAARIPHSARAASKTRAPQAKRRPFPANKTGPPRRESPKTICFYIFGRAPNSAPRGYVHDLLARIGVDAVHRLHIVAEGAHFCRLADVGCGIEVLHRRLLLACELGGYIDGDGDVHVARTRARL